MKIVKIISGGQTGAERGGLDAAEYCHIPHGGWCPKNRLADDGRIPDGYALQEMSTQSYLSRIEFNVVSSDATLIFSAFGEDVIALRTVEFATKLNKPYLLILTSKTKPDYRGQEIPGWLTNRRKVRRQVAMACWPPAQCVLNVTGERESSYPGIHDLVMTALVEVIGIVNEEPVILPCLSNSDGDSDLRTSKANDASTESRSKSIDDAQYHPSTLEEAAEIVLGLIPVQEKEEILLYKTVEAFQGEIHFGLALWIRNAMAYQNRNWRLLMADATGHEIDSSEEAAQCAEYLDDAIVRRLWEKLHAAEMGDA